MKTLSTEEDRSMIIPSEETLLHSGVSDNNIIADKRLYQQPAASNESLDSTRIKREGAAAAEEQHSTQRSSTRSRSLVGSLRYHQNTIQEVVEGTGDSDGVKLSA